MDAVGIARRGIGLVLPARPFNRQLRFANAAGTENGDEARLGIGGELIELVQFVFTADEGLCLGWDVKS